MKNKDKTKNNNGVIVCSKGDVFFCVNLQHNILSCVQFILENEKTILSTKYLGTYLREIACFYELFFKYNLLLISKSFVWKNVENYDEAKHNEAKMATISYGSVLIHALCIGWINKKEFDEINELKEIRNKLIHFSCGEFVCKNSGQFSSVKINLDFHIALIKSLLKTHKNKFDSPLYAIIETNYLIPQKDENHGE